MKKQLFRVVRKYATLQGARLPKNQKKFCPFGPPIGHPKYDRGYFFHLFCLIHVEQEKRSEMYGKKVNIKEYAYYRTVPYFQGLKSSIMVFHIITGRCDIKISRNNLRAFRLKQFVSNKYALVLCSKSLAVTSYLSDQIR